MYVFRCREAECPLQQHLPRRVAEEVAAADHLSHALGGIVDDHGELISEQSIAAPDDEIAERGRNVLYVLALERVAKGDRTLSDAKSRRERTVGMTRPLATEARIEEFLGVRGTGSIVCGQFLAAARTNIRASRSLQGRQRRFVGFRAGALVEDRTVPFEAEPFERAQNIVRCSGNYARRVEILHAHEPFAALRTCLEIAA